MRATRRARPLSFVVAVFVLGACGGPAASSSTNAPTTSGAETPTVQVLVLGVRLSAGRFDVMPDGSLMFGSTFAGRLDPDGTLRREDGTVLARLARDGAFVIADPSRALRGPLVVRIEGDSLVVAERSRPPEVLVSIESGALVRDSRREPVEGLTPDRYRTMLAAHALMLLLLSESHMPMM